MRDQKSITDITDLEFIELIAAITTEADCADLTQFNALLNRFTSIVEHPDGTDLLFYTFGDDSTPEAITAEVKRWYAENNKPCFKDR